MRAATKVAELPSVIELDQAEESSAVQNSSTTSAALPRGFKSGWTKDQRRQMLYLLHGDSQQQLQQDRPPEITGDHTAVAGTEIPPEKAVECPIEGGNNVPPPGVELATSPSFLSAADVATLGAPGGEEIDPAMTAIFKV